MTFAKKLTALWKRYFHVNLVVADQAFVSGMNFLTGVVLARYLGLAEFGVFTLAWLMAIFVNGVQNALVINPMMSVGPKIEPLKESDYYGDMAIQELVVATCSFLLIFIGALASDILYPQWRAGSMAAPLACATFAFQLQDFVRRYFFTRLRVGPAFLSDLISYGGKLGLFALLVYTGIASAANVLWVITLSSLTGAICGGFFMDKMTWGGRANFTSTVRRNFQLGKWLVASESMRWVSESMFTIFAGILLGASAAGALKACQTIMGVTHIMFFALNNIALVKASKAVMSGGLESLGRFLTRLGMVTCGVTFLFALVVVIFPGYLLTTIYGPEYEPFVWALRGFAGVYFLRAMKLPLETGLKALEYTNPLFVANATAMIFSLIAANLVVGWYGIYGAVYGMLFMEIIKFFIKYTGFQKAKKLSPLLQPDAL